MVDRDLLLERLSILAEYVNDLEAEMGVTWDQFIQDKKLRRHIERTLQLAIEACLDLGNHVISDLHLREPQDYKDIFAVLVESGFLPEEDKKVYEKMAGFRNILVHGYARIDPAIVFGVLKRDLPYFRKFAQAMSVFLERSGQGK